MAVNPWGMQNQGGYVNFNAGGGGQSMQASGAAQQTQKAQGYTGPYYGSQNYADAYGQNFGRAADILQGGFSGQSQGATDLQNALRQAAMGRLNQPNMADQMKTSLKSDLEQGFSNNLAQLRRGAAGTGAGSSLGYGRAVGDLSGQYQQNLGKGMLAADLQGQQMDINNMNAASGVGNTVYGQELANRQQTLNQANDLSGLYMQMAGKEEGNQQQADAIQRADTLARQQAQSALISSIMSGAGMALAGPAGGMAGAQLGGSMGGGAQQQQYSPWSTQGLGLFMKGMA